MILEERVSYILRHFGHSQDVTLTFLVSIDADAIVEYNAVIPNRLESAGKELVQSRAGVDPGHLLEQLRPLIVLIITPEWIITAFL